MISFNDNSDISDVSLTYSRSRGGFNLFCQSLTSERSAYFGQSADQFWQILGHSSRTYIRASQFLELGNKMVNE